MKVRLGGKTLRLDPALALGKGGEADVFDIGGGRALKVFKGPDHPDLDGDSAGQAAARLRLDEHQEKLRRFPTHLPPRVVRPEELAEDGGGRVVGYAMRLLRGADALHRYGERAGREAAGGGDAVVAAFRDLHGTVAALHRVGVVVGDFNDLNVLVSGTEAHVIDGDSFQFGAFPCRVFTERFVDPRLCDPAAPRPVLVRPFDADSDWYAYAVMLFRSLLLVDPYGGVLKAGAASPPGARVLRRITVLHPDVRYPKPALCPDVLPDDLLQHFHAVFEKDRRGAFPVVLVESLRWTRCTLCGAEHARTVCPSCTAAAPAALREVVVVRGDVRATRAFATRGRILAAEADHRGLRLLVHESGRLLREDGAVVLEGEPPPRTRFRLSGDRTHLGRGRTLVTLAPGLPPERRTVDDHVGRLLFDTQGDRLYWIDAGCLWREGALGPERIGDVLAGQTLFWVGPRFGFGFSRAGALHVAFVFGTAKGGLRDGVRLPPLRGHLVQADCVFTAERAFFLAATEESGRRIHRCVVLRADGSIEATSEAEPGDGSWLSVLGGKCAAGPVLLSPTDDGIVRAEVRDGRLLETRRYADTEPFVDAGCRLLPARDGVYVIDEREVRLLKIG